MQWLSMRRMMREITVKKPSVLRSVHRTGMNSISRNLRNRQIASCLKAHPRQSTLPLPTPLYPACHKEASINPKGIKITTKKVQTCIKILSLSLKVQSPACKRELKAEMVIVGVMLMKSIMKYFRQLIFLRRQQRENLRHRPSTRQNRNSLTTMKARIIKIYRLLDRQLNVTPILPNHPYLPTNIAIFSPCPTKLQNRNARSIFPSSNNLANIQIKLFCKNNICDNFSRKLWLKLGCVPMFRVKKFSKFIMKQEKKKLRSRLQPSIIRVSAFQDMGWMFQTVLIIQAGMKHSTISLPFIVKTSLSLRQELTSMTDGKETSMVCRSQDRSQVIAPPIQPAPSRKYSTRVCSSPQIQILTLSRRICTIQASVCTSLWRYRMPSMSFTFITMSIRRNCSAGPDGTAGGRGRGRVVLRVVLVEVVLTGVGVGVVLFPDVFDDAFAGTKSTTMLSRMGVQSSCWVTAPGNRLALPLKHTLLVVTLATNSAQPLVTVVQSLCTTVKTLTPLTQAQAVAVCTSGMLLTSMLRQQRAPMVRVKVWHMLIGQMSKIISLVPLVPVPQTVFRTSTKPQAEAYQHEQLLGNSLNSQKMPSKVRFEVRVQLSKSPLQIKLECDYAINKASSRGRHREIVGLGID